MKPFAPARVGHFAVRDSANVVGNNARWTLENNPRGLYPVRSRWQRLNPNPDVGAPTVELVDFDTLAQRADLTDQRISEESWTKRIEARQVGIARRMIS